MYYMELQTPTQPKWSSKGLLSLLRATLPPAKKAPAAGSAELNPPPARLGSRQLSDLARKWRCRSAAGDEGADSVADALEMLAERRAHAERRRLQAVSQRLSAFMQLS